MGESGARAVSGSELIGAAAKQVWEAGMGTEGKDLLKCMCAIFLPFSE